MASSFSCSGVGIVTASPLGTPLIQEGIRHRPTRWMPARRLRPALLLLLTTCGNSSPDRCHHQEPTGPTAGATEPRHLRTVFLIVLENHAWEEIRGNPSAPFLNSTLLPAASHAERYFNPPGLHPSEPNYLWLEGGTNYGITNDDPPSRNHLPDRDHLVTQLDAAGISWTSYQEGITGQDCPLVDEGKYAPKHNPMIFFDDVTNENDPHSAGCIAHVRPLTELVPALRDGSVARYVFITPDLCHDMHDTSGCASPDQVQNGDDWLRIFVPEILGSQAYQGGGALFITWDESEGGDRPIGMIVLSEFAKGNGYSNTVQYTHGSTLRTVQEIFGVGPFLCDAAQATDLSDLFAVFP
jgi:phosphatidylinositol-3-phosphatase